ncbi:hypothetical protein, partial [Acidaminococcus intestini]|uniref:hypothetical protein n=3 Tax=Acidaminococcus intestini TaxID=187327 RepID=UPI00307DEBCB
HPVGSFASELDFSEIDPPRLGKAERHSPSLRQKIKPDSANKKKPFPAFVLRKIVRINQIKNIAIPKKSRKPNSCLDSVCGSLFMLSLLP